MVDFHFPQIKLLSHSKSMMLNINIPTVLPLSGSKVKMIIKVKGEKGFTNKFHAMQRQMKSCQ